MTDPWTDPREPHRPAARRPAGAPERLKSRVAYRNAWMTVREDVLRHPDGSDGLYGVVDKPDFALIVPRERDGFHLVEQYRYPVGGRFWEFPQGSWPGETTPTTTDAPPRDGAADEGPSADALALARAELREETGLVAGTLTWLGRLHVAHGYSSQGCQVFLAEDLTRHAPSRETTEADMAQRWVDAGTLDRMVAGGRFVDAPSLAALALLHRHPLGRRRTDESG
ncbi:NUDIX hydrolase [Streptomyces sp. NPDC048737]|uniref:NUDIX hydrolase n=1 Tax=unclassified Streptomyces TaxID=2593676 RepID=UPI00343EC81C